MNEATQKNNGKKRLKEKMEKVIYIDILRDNETFFLGNH